MLQRRKLVRNPEPWRTPNGYPITENNTRRDISVGNRNCVRHIVDEYVIDVY